MQRIARRDGIDPARLNSAPMPGGVQSDPDKLLAAYIAEALREDALLARDEELDEFAAVGGGAVAGFTAPVGKRTKRRD